jgi:hypothetical protein
VAKAAEAAHLIQLEGVVSIATERRRRNEALLETIGREVVQALCEPKRREGRGGGGGRRFFVQSACNDRYATRDIRPASVL